MKLVSRRKFLRTAGRYSIAGLSAAPLVSLLGGCLTVGTVGSLGDIGSKMESAMKIGKAVAKSVEDITPEQEYYIGRTVGATILATYKPYNGKRANQYANILGQTLAQASDLPETYGGYHLQVLDSDDINAFAAPGGLIFVTRGILRCCQNEDAVAAVLAHEIGHVQLKHGIKAIDKSRLTSALSTIALEGAKQFGSAELSSLTETFEKSIGDITATLINNGYSRSFEREADEAAITILKRVGYSPNGLIDMLNVMKTKLNPEGTDFAKTHPSPESRIKNIKKKIGDDAKVVSPKARQARFRRALGKI